MLDPRHPIHGLLHCQVATDQAAKNADIVISKQHLAEILTSFGQKVRSFARDVAATDQAVTDQAGAVSRSRRNATTRSRAA